MKRFLSEEWIARLVDAFSASNGVRSAVQDAALTLQQNVTGAPRGDVRYWIAFERGAVRGGIEDPPQSADVTITQDYETAVMLSRGDINPQAAFMQGRLKITGNMGKLLQHSAAIEALGPAMSTIETEY